MRRTREPGTLALQQSAHSRANRAQPSSVDRRTRAHARSSAFRLAAHSVRPTGAGARGCAAILKRDAGVGTRPSVSTRCAAGERCSVREGKGEGARPTAATQRGLAPRQPRMRSGSPTARRAEQPSSPGSPARPDSSSTKGPSTDGGEPSEAASPAGSPDGREARVPGHGTHRFHGASRRGTDGRNPHEQWRAQRARSRGVQRTPPRPRAPIASRLVVPLSLV